MKMAMAMFALLCGLTQTHKEYQYGSDIERHQSKFACKMSGQKYTCEFNPQDEYAMLPEEWISNDETFMKAKYKKEAPKAHKVKSSKPSKSSKSSKSHKSSSHSSSSKGGKGMGVWSQFLMGCVMITCAFPCIWMNERRQVRTYKLINAAQESAKVVENVDEINEDLNEALVLAVGEIICSDEMKDDKFESIVKSEALALKRSV